METNISNYPNSISSSVKVDPIMSLNTKNVKNDILIFKNETLKDFKDAQKKISDKYNTLNMQVLQKLDTYEKRIQTYELKIIELSNLINTDKTIRDKVDKLIEFKENADESMLTEKIRLDNFRNDLNTNINRIDDILRDSVIYPGIIGGISKYKNFHEFMDYVLSQCSQNLTFREKSIIDLKSYKTKLDNIISSFNTQITNLLNTTSEYTKTAVQECEERMKSIYNVYDDRLQDARIENANYAIGLERATDALKKELENLYVVKNELYEKVDNGISEIKNDNLRVIKLFTNYKKNFNLLQHKFTQLSDFIKDVRFRLNLKEDFNRREYAHMSDMINFDKKKKGFMDGVNLYDKSYLRKGLESQLKDYISGKISAEDLFKKKGTKSKPIDNNIKQVEAFKRNSLSSGMLKLNEGVKPNLKDAMRGSMALPKKSVSLENQILKLTNRDDKKKESIKEEEDENNYSLDFKKSENNVENQNDDFLKDLYEDVKINDTSPKKENRIQIISKDKDNEDNKNKDSNNKDSNNKDNDNINNEKIKLRTSLKNVINDIFNVKNIINNIKNNKATSETIDNKNNKSERKISTNINTNNANTNNINQNNNSNSMQKLINNINTNADKNLITNQNAINNKSKTISSNNKEKESLHVDIKNDTNKNNKININNKNNNVNNNNNKSSSMTNFRNKNLNEKNLNINNQVINSAFKKIEINPISKANNKDNYKISGQIKKKLLNNNLTHSNSNILINNNNSIKSFNYTVKMNKINKKPYNMNKPYNNNGKNMEKSAENFILYNFIPINDINVDENNNLMLKKKNNVK